MEKTKYTPGPWKVSAIAKHPLYSNDYVTNVEGNGKFVACLVQAETRELAEVEANARLIAAAPELLEALTNLTKMVEDGDHTTIELNEARAAIKKAEGAQ